MDSLNWKYQNLLLADDPDQLVFFKIGNNPLVKIHRSILVQSSTVFKDMFIDGVTNNDPLTPIVIDDKTGCDTFKGFMLFVGALYEKDVSSFLEEPPCTQAILKCQQVYFFADKYQVIELVEKCKESAKKLLGRLQSKYIVSIPAITLCMKIVEEMSIPEEMIIIRKMRLLITKKNLIEYFRSVQEWGIQELMDQFVAASCHLDFDPSWPPELSTLVFKRLKGFASKQQLKGTLTDQQLRDILKESG